jgi:hypothetical protein
MQFALFIFLNRKWDSDSVEISKFIDYYKTVGKNFWVFKNLKPLNFIYRLIFSFFFS